MKSIKVKELNWPGLKADLERCHKQLAEICQGERRLAIMSVPPEPTDFDMRFSAAFDELTEYRTFGSIDHLRELVQAEKDGRVVVLPCKVGDTVYVIAHCADVVMNYDDNYETGTGAVECPYEGNCDFEECDDEHVQVLPCAVANYLINADGVLFGVEELGPEYRLYDFGKTVFLTRAAAEAALEAQKGGAE